jgi:hypothetical protein
VVFQGRFLDEVHDLLALLAGEINYH